MKSRSAGITAALAVGMCLLGSSVLGHAGSGQVLPPAATPLGYSLDDMASAVANFSVSGNDLMYYPDTPFQIIYRDSDNTFVVRPGTYLYLKFFYINDAAPAIGNWPADKEGAAEYVFGRTQLGAHDFEVEVDGRVYSLDDPGYIGGPVATPDSLDGGENLIQVGAFLSPLGKGTHTIKIRGVIDGDAFVEAVGFVFAPEIVYTVIVE